MFAICISTDCKCTDCNVLDVKLEMYGVPSPPKIKVGTQHPTLGMNIGLCRVTSIFFECNFELLHAKSDNTNRSST